MRNPSQLFAISTGALLLGGFLASPAVGEEAAAQKGFSFKLDPLVVEVLDSHVDTNSAKWEEYRDMSNGFTIPLLHLTGESADGNREVDLRAVNVDRTDARYSLDYGVSGKYELFVDYNKIPHHFGNDGHMLWTRTGPGVYEIPDPVQQQIQTAIVKQYGLNPAGITYGFLNGLLAPYLATATPVDLGLERDRALARLDLGRMGPFAWTLEYTHENRRGNRPYGASFGFGNATEIPEPIDYDTSGAELAGEWKASQGGLRFGYRFSDFKNNIESLTYDNPFRATNSTDPSAYTAPGSGSINGASRGLAALAPSNRANVGYLNGQYKLGSWWLNGTATYDQMRQNESLLPYTLNSAIVGIADNGAKFDPTNPSNLPTRSFDGKVNTTNVTASAGTHFGGNLDFTMRYRYYDYDDQSPRIEFPGYVRFNSVWEQVARITVPYSYTRQNASAELGWNVAPSTRLALGYENEGWDRQYREVKTTNENIFKLTADTHPSQRFSLRGSYEHGDRTIGSYNPAAQEDSFVEAEALTNLPDLRKYDEAARTYNAWNLLAQIFATDTVNLSLGSSGRRDDYDKSLFGLSLDDIKSYNAELSYTPGAKLDFFVFGQYSDRRSLQNDRVSGATPSTNPLDNWAADLKEKTDTWGVGLNSVLSPAWTFNLTGNWSRSRGTADFPRPTGAVPGVGFNNYENVELISLVGHLDYKINPLATAELYYRWEKYTIDSFILQGLANYLPGALLLNANNGDFQGSLYGVALRVGF